MFNSIAHKGVRVILFNDKDELLLVKHIVSKEKREFWILPGGGLEKDEYSYEGAIREMKEETGLDVEIDDLIYHVEEKCEGGLRCTNYFTAHKTGGELILGLDPEFDELNQVLSDIQYFSREAIQSLANVYPGVVRDDLWDMLEHPRGGKKIWRTRPSQGFSKK